MKTKYSQEDIDKILAASHGSLMRNRVELCTRAHFRGGLYLSGRLITDCVLLNLVLNESITPHSADEIITIVHRANRGFFTTVEAAYRPIADEFSLYAEQVIGEGYNKEDYVWMRAVDFLVYVMSLDLSRVGLNRDEIILEAFSYKELLDGKGEVGV